MRFSLSNNINETLDQMKIFLMFLVVLGHVLVMYTDRGLFEIPHDSNVWKYIADFIYLFHMPVFVSISGIIYAICKSKGKYNYKKEFVINKFNRLLIPYMFFSLLMFATLYYIDKFPSNNIFGHFVYAFIFGVNCRHLWYLYTLFAIFVLYNTFYSFIRKYQYSFTIIFIVLNFFCDKFPLEFQLHNIAYYLIYFHFGVIFYTHRVFLEKIIYDRHVFILSIFFSIVIFCFSISLMNIDMRMTKVTNLLCGMTSLPFIYGISKLRMLPPRQ